MEKRYQVFVSSTFEDLEDARKEISSALLKSDCFPAGMELFPAADLEQFEYIKQIIEESDYFIIVSAGKYGSIHPKTGLSFTEMEYDFAVTIGKPIIRLLHRDPLKSLPGKAIEQSDVGRKKLETLREKLTRSRLVNFWNSIGDLGQQTILALLDIKKRNPSHGWVRGENALTVDIMKELETLRTSAKTSSSNNFEEQISFDDLKGKKDVSIYAETDENDNKEMELAPIDNKIIAESVFLALISNRSAAEIRRAASDLLTEKFSFPKKYDKYAYYWLELDHQVLEYFLHYLESRGLIKGSSSNIVSDWQLTQRGRMQATRLSSVRNLA